MKLLAQITKRKVFMFPQSRRFGYGYRRRNFATMPRFWRQVVNGDGAKDVPPSIAYFPDWRTPRARPRVLDKAQA